MDLLPKSHVEKLNLIIQQLEEGEDAALSRAKKDAARMTQDRVLKTIGKQF